MTDGPQDPHRSRRLGPAPVSTALAYAVVTVAVAGAGGAAALLRAELALPNLSLVFLVAVLASAVAFGLWPSVYASSLSVLVYNFFFVQPYYTFAIQQPQDVLALIVYLVVAVLTSSLTGRMRQFAEDSRRREATTAALYDVAADLVVADGPRAVVTVVAAHIYRELQAPVVVNLREGGRLVHAAGRPDGMRLPGPSLLAAEWSLGNATASGRNLPHFGGDVWRHVPMRTSDGSVGVISIELASRTARLSSDEERLLTALIDQASVAIARAHLAEEVDRTRVAAEREHLQSVFLSAVSHELRTPLSSILGTATALLDPASRPEAGVERELLASMRDEASRLDRTVGHLLDAARLESGALRLRLDWTDLGDVVTKVVADLETREHNHSIHVSIGSDVPELRLDFVLMEQVVANLIDNAVQYSPAGTAVRVALTATEAWVDLSVEDEGPGIPQEQASRIFERFYRLASGTRSRRGLGLGLSICAGIVRAHGGTIELTSPARELHGSRFTVRLPITETPPAVEQEIETDTSES